MNPLEAFLNSFLRQEMAFLEMGLSNLVRHFTSLPPQYFFHAGFLKLPGDGIVNKKLRNTLIAAPFESCIVHTFVEVVG